MRRRTPEWCGNGGKITGTFAHTDTVGSNNALTASFFLSISHWYTLWYTQSHPTRVGRVLVGIGGIQMSMTLIGYTEVWISLSIMHGLVLICGIFDGF